MVGQRELLLQKEASENIAGRPVSSAPASRRALLGRAKVKKRLVSRFVLRS